MKAKTDSAQAKAEIFWMAFRALPKPERRTVVHRFIVDKEFREDLLDLAVFEQRRNEPSRPFRAYLRDRNKKLA